MLFRSTNNKKRFNQWDEQEFFETGASVVSRAVAWMDENGYPKQRMTALDFGCGVGRLTQSLCETFKTCVGVDIAPSMIRKAKEYNKYGMRCAYKLNESDDLSLFKNGSFDLVYTEHVLQHIAPKIALRYIAEFVRVLRPGGLAMFHCPSTKATFAYPPEGIHCEVTPQVQSIVMEQGDLAAIPLSVKNTGSHPIGLSKTINAPLQFFHHWICKKTGKLYQRHGYMNLPTPMLLSGETHEFTYQAASPPEPGEYNLVLNPAEMGKQALSNSEPQFTIVDVQVSPSTKFIEIPDEKKGERPVMQMHAIPVETVQRIVKENGGRIVDIQTQQDRPGALVGARYRVTR